MQRITILNMKGGCGKTTMATNLAAYFSKNGKKTVLIDYDPQGSSTNWIERRNGDYSQVYSIPAFDRGATTTRVWQLLPPNNTDIVISDTPASIDKLLLKKIVNRSDVILVPVMPSKVDIHAAAHFIETLLIDEKAKAKGKRIGVIANRIHKHTISFKSLEAFINHLDIPLVAKFRGLENYVYAIGEGIGIHELPERLVCEEIAQWDQLTRWLMEC